MDEIITQKLTHAGLRPTRQRVALAALLWKTQGHRHVTADELHKEAEKAGQPVSLATVYNTLHQFTQAGLLREVSTGGERVFFDTNTEPHHHFLYEATEVLEDIPAGAISLAHLPSAPEGMHIRQVDVVLRLEKTA